MNKLINQSLITDALKTYLINSRRMIMPKKPAKPEEKIRIVEMTEQEAEVDFIYMYKEFLRFINDNSDFKIEKIDQVHAGSLELLDNEMFEVLVADYYFMDETEEKQYTLDITRDIAEFGYNEDYKKYDKNTVFCKIVEYRNYFDIDAKKYEMDFAFDISNKRLVEIIAVERKAIDNKNTEIYVRLEDEEKLEKIIKRNSI